MIRPLAASFASLAMAIVVMRGGWEGTAIDRVASQCVIALAAFAVVGAVSGWLMDRLLREQLQDVFQRRVQWYRDGMASLDAEPSSSSGMTEPTSS